MLVILKDGLGVQRGRNQRDFKSYVLQIDCDQQNTLCKIYVLKMSPFRKEWKTLNGLTFVSLRNQENVINNLSLAVLKEFLGMGPKW